MTDFTTDDELPPRHLLEALTVPTLPSDFTDRVMDQLHPPHRPALSTPSRLPWVIALVSTAVAAAAVAGLVALRPAATIDRGEGIPAPVASPPSAPTPAPAVAAPATPTLGHVVLTLEPHDAEVRLDGERREGTSPVAITNLGLGRHTLQVERAGFEPWTQTIDIPDDVLQLTVRLVPIPATPPLDIEAFVPQPATPSRPKAKKRVGGGSPDLKDPFGYAAPRSDPPGSASADMKDPFGSK